MNDTGKSSPSLSDATIKAIQAENANLRADLQAEKAAHEQTKQSWKADFELAALWKSNANAERSKHEQAEQRIALVETELADREQQLEQSRDANSMQVEYFGKIMDKLEQQLAAAQATIGRLRHALKSLEWNGRDRTCPACGRYESHNLPHYPACILGDELTQKETPCQRP